MTVIAIGLNHRSAPLEVLERLSMSADLVPKALAEITSADHVNEAVVLSTCNRTEIYAHVEGFHDAYREVRDAIALLTGADQDEFVDHLYVHYHDDAIQHLFHVAAGLDSAVLGEHEILGQVRTSWEMARLEGAADSLINPLFEFAIRCGKRVRTDTAIGRRTASISMAAVQLIEERIGSLEGQRVLLVGAGEVGAGVANAIQNSTTVDLVVTNRTASRADELARSLGGRSVPFEALRDELAHADVVVTATGAPGTVIEVADVEAAMAQRHDKSLLILDLAVPRDVEAGVLGISSVGLLVLSDLQAFANRGLAERQKEAVAARRVVDEEIESFRAASSAREVAPLLSGMHRWADSVRLDEIDRYRNRLGDLSDEQQQAVEALTKAVVNKLLHEPSVTLKSAAGSKRGDRLAEAVRDLFDLG